MCMKGKKILILPWKEFKEACAREKNENLLAQIGGMRGTVLMKGTYKLFESEKMEIIIKATRLLNLEPIEEKQWQRKLNLHISTEENLYKLINSLSSIMRVTEAKKASKELGFICLFTDGNGTYWYKVSRGFQTALNESLSSLEKLIDDISEREISIDMREKVNIVYRVLNSLYE